jgi:hypothetical protein
VGYGVPPQTLLLELFFVIKGIGIEHLSVSWTDNGAFRPLSFWYIRDMKASLPHDDSQGSLKVAVSLNSNQSQYPLSKDCARFGSAVSVSRPEPFRSFAILEFIGYERRGSEKSGFWGPVKTTVFGCAIYSRHSSGESPQHRYIAPGGG